MNIRFNLISGAAMMAFATVCVLIGVMHIIDALPVPYRSSLPVILTRRAVTASTRQIVLPPITNRAASKQNSVSADSLQGRATEPMSKSARREQLNYIGYSDAKDIEGWIAWANSLQSQYASIGTPTPSSVLSDSNVGASFNILIVSNHHCRNF
jgi:hypothetical protein